MSREDFWDLTGFQAHDGIDVVSYASRFRDVEKCASGKNRISWKKDLCLKLVDPYGAWCVTRRVDDLKRMASDVKKGSVFQPEVDTEGDFIPIPGTIEGDVVVFQSDFGRRETMGSDKRRFLKISIGTNVVQMLVSVNDQIGFLLKWQISVSPVLSHLSW